MKTIPSLHGKNNSYNLKTRNAWNHNIHPHSQFSLAGFTQTSSAWFDEFFLLISYINCAIIDFFFHLETSAEGGEIDWGNTAGAVEEICPRTAASGEEEGEAGGDASWGDKVGGLEPWGWRRNHVKSFCWNLNLILNFAEIWKW